MEDQILLRVPPRVAEPIRRFINGEADADVALEPLDDDGNFLFTVGAETFPAKLVRLPTVAETHKTGDHKTYYKSGDVSRMLFVYEPKGQLEGAGAGSSSASASGGGGGAEPPDPAADDVAKLLPMVPDPTPGSGGELICDSGITPPTAHIVRRRFRRAHRFISKYPREEVAEAERVLLDLMAREAYEHVVEELVDAEPFMAPWFAGGGDNVTVVYEDGVVTDMYQLQCPLGVEAREIRGFMKPLDPLVVKPNLDGAFGKPRQAAAAGPAAAAGAGADGAAPPPPVSSTYIAGRGYLGANAAAAQAKRGGLAPPRRPAARGGAKAAAGGLGRPSLGALGGGSSGMLLGGSAAAAPPPLPRIDEPPASLIPGLMDDDNGGAGDEDEGGGTGAGGDYFGGSQPQLPHPALHNMDAEMAALAAAGEGGGGATTGFEGFGGPELDGGLMGLPFGGDDGGEDELMAAIAAASQGAAGAGVDGGAAAVDAAAFAPVGTLAADAAGGGGGGSMLAMLGMPAPPSSVTPDFYGSGVGTAAAGVVSPLDEGGASLDATASHAAATAEGAAAAGAAAAPTSAPYAAEVSSQPPLPPQTAFMDDDSALEAAAAAAAAAAEAAAAAPSVAGGGGREALLAAHPEGARLLAELAAQQARLAELRAAQAKQQEQHDRATLPAMRSRWRAMLDKGAPALAEAEARVAATQAALDALPV